MTDKERDRIECAIRHIQTAVDVDSWAAEIAVEAMRKLFGNTEQLDCSDCVNHGGDWDCDHVHCHKGTDTIIRAAAITEIMEDLNDRSLHDDPGTPEDYAEGYDEGIRNAAAIVLQMPSAQQWIPCKERLPSDYQWYYATCKSLVDNRENWVVEGCYTPWEHFNSTPMIKCGEAEVIAWMPKEFPEPWKGEEDG